MSQKSPRPKFRQATAAEQNVAARISAQRRFAGLNQADLAKKIGMTRNQLANVELGRTRLRLGTALKIAEVLRISVAWLAEDFGPALHYIAPAAVMLQKVSENAPFLQEYEKALRDFFRNKLSDILPQPPVFKAMTKDDVMAVRLHLMGTSLEEIMPTLAARVDWMIKALPPKLQGQFFWQINDAMREFVRKHRHELPLTVQPGATNQEQEQKKYLTDASTHATFQIVKPQLPSLLERLNRATKETGKMSALATFLAKATGRKVPLASVSRWLSGKREPGGEITLLLRSWVEQQERQK